MLGFFEVLWLPCQWPREILCCLYWLRVSASKRRPFKFNADAGVVCSGCPLWSHGLLSFPVASFRRQQWIVRVPFCPQTQQSSLGWLLHHRAMCPTALHLEHLLLMSNDLVMPPVSACVCRKEWSLRAQLLFTLVWERWRFPKPVWLIPLASPSRYQQSPSQRVRSEQRASIFRELRGSSGSYRTGAPSHQGERSSSQSWPSELPKVTSDESRPTKLPRHM